MLSKGAQIEFGGRLRYPYVSVSRGCDLLTFFGFYLPAEWLLLRIWSSSIQIPEVVVRVPMMGLIGSNALQHLPDHCILRKLVIRFCDRRCRKLFKQRKITGIDLLQDVCVCPHSFLFKVTNKAVARRWNQ